MSGVLSVGIAVLDYIYGVGAIPTTPEKHRATALTVVGGGLAANASVAIARLGGRSYLATRLGHDLTADSIIAGLEAEQVDCGFARRFEGRVSPVSAIMVDASGERMVMSYSDPAMPVDPGWLPSALPDDVTAVLGDTRWLDGALVLFTKARAAGFPAVLDADRAPGMCEVYTSASHIAFSKQAICEVTGCLDLRDGVASLGREKPCWVAATDGANGVYHWDGAGVIHTPSFQVKVVDTLGAGDVWHGAFALALAEGQNEIQAIRFANASAALKCMKFGGRAGTPSRSEVETFLRERTDG
jgi:sulfofructose kinase